MSSQYDWEGDADVSAPCLMIEIEDGDQLTTIAMPVSQEVADALSRLMHDDEKGGQGQ